MGFGQAIATCFSKYVSFRGRAARPEYWWWVLFVIVVPVIILAVGAAVMSASSLPWMVTGLFYLVIILPTIAVAVRRLHDTDHTGWWFFIQLVPVIGGLWFLYFMVISGTQGPNRFGDGTALS
jgi:uncharacterized membrane protein YhaH (DUF805 family)